MLLLMILILLLVGILSASGVVALVRWSSVCTIFDMLDRNVDSLHGPGAGTVFDHSGFDIAPNDLTFSSVPAVTTGAAFTLMLTAGAATIDLTALPALNGVAENATGKKIQLLRIKNLGVNPMTFAQGASNGYVLGSTILIQPGGVYMQFANGGLPTIDATHKTIDVAGTLVESAQITIALG